MSPRTMALLAVVFVYYLACIGVGLYVYRKGKGLTSSTEFFLAGRALGPIVLGLAMLGTVQSAWMMLGHQGLSMAIGAPYWVYYAHMLLMAMVAIFFFPHQWLLGKKFGFISPAEMYGDYYGTTTRWLMLLVAVLYIVPYLCLQLVGAGTVLQTLSGGEIPFLWGAIGITFAIMLYVFLGGLRGAAILDCVQGGLLVLGIFALAILVLANVPGGWTGLLEAIKGYPTEFRLIPGAKGEWPWQYILTLAIAPVGIYTSPVYTVWAFSARTPKIFRWQLTVIIGCIAMFYYYILSPIIGAGGRALFGVVQPIDALTPTILARLAPTWLMILISIGLFAAINTTGDAFMNVAGNVLSRDIFTVLKPQSTDAQRVWFGRFMIVFVTFCGLVFALKTGDVIVLLGSLATSFGLQCLPALVGIIYWRKFTPAGINAGVIVGVVTIFLTYAVWKYPLGVHCSVWGLAANLVVSLVVSLFTEQVPEDKKARYAETLRKGQKAYERKLAAGVPEKVSAF